MTDQVLDGPSIGDNRSRVVDFPYEPRPHFYPYHSRTQRWAAIVAHRRAGKTVACVNDLVASAVTTNKSAARYGYIAPFYSQAKQIAWDYLKHYAAPATSRALESELSVRLVHNDATVRLYGADNADALRGIYLDGVILDEFGMMRPSVWSTVVLPTLADRRGWATFIGTPMGKNHFYEVTRHAKQHPEEWFYLSLPASKTKILGEFELSEQRRLMDEDEYAQEYECSFDAAIKGAVFGKEIRAAEESDRISTSHKLQNDMPVHAVCDLGFTDDTAFWFWQPRPEGFLLTYSFHDNFRIIEDYINKLLMLPNLGDVWLPHDARAKSLQTGKSIIEQFLQAGIRPKLVPRMAFHDGIAAARKVLPHCYFALPGTEDGVEALKQYQRPWDEDLKTYRERPTHDWTSHYSDAFRYFSLVVKPFVPQAVPLRESVLSHMKTYTLDNLFADREKQLKAIGRRI